MFFSSEILASKKKGSLAIIWLAATLGSKAQAKKLTKKDYSSVNVPEACRFLMEPPEPMALRLSSNLMFGIAKIYNQQYQIYYAEVHEFWCRLNTSSFHEPKKDDMTIMPAAKMEAITIEAGTEFELPILPQRWTPSSLLDDTFGLQSPSLLLTPERARYRDDDTAMLSRPLSKNIDMPVPFAMSSSSLIGGRSRQDSYSSLNIGRIGNPDFQTDDDFGNNDDLLQMDELIKDSLSEIDKEERNIVPCADVLFPDHHNILVPDEPLISNGTSSGDNDGIVPQIKKKRRRNVKSNSLAFDDTIEIPAEQMSQMIKDRSSIVALDGEIDTHEKSRREVLLSKTIAKLSAPAVPDWEPECLVLWKISPLKQVQHKTTIKRRNRASLPSMGEIHESGETFESCAYGFMEDTIISGPHDSMPGPSAEMATPIRHGSSRVFPWTSSPLQRQGQQASVALPTASPLERKTLPKRVAGKVDENTDEEGSLLDSLLVSNKSRASALVLSRKGSEDVQMFYK